MHRPHIVVLGSGFAGLETAFRLRAAVGDQARLVVVSDSGEFLFKPNTIYLPFGAAEAKLHVPLANAMRRRDITHYVAKAIEVDPAKGTVHTDHSGTFHYDHLVIATGAAMRPDEIPGLAGHTRQIWTPSQMHDIGDDLQWLIQAVRRGQRQQVLFAVPPNNKCAGPLYELVFMLDTWLRRQDIRGDVDLALTTHESSFLQAFGPKLHTIATDQFATREIDAHVNTVVIKVNEREAMFADGTTQPFDLMVTFPPHVAATRYPGLPSDDRGFLRCRKASRAVVDHDEIHAPGDAGDFPVKQAYLALLQANAAALDIAAAIRNRPPEGGFEPISMCVMDMLNTATFAQVPLRLTGDPDSPVTVDSALADRYRAGTSTAWRAGKKLLGAYLPTRFRHGLPFHAGAPWHLMQQGLRLSAAALAD